MIDTQESQVPATRSEQAAKAIRRYAAAVEKSHVQGVYMDSEHIINALLTVAVWVEKPDSIPPLDDCMDELQIYDAGVSSPQYMPF